MHVWQPRSACRASAAMLRSNVHGRDICRAHTRRSKDRLRPCRASLVEIAELEKSETSSAPAGGLERAKARLLEVVQGTVRGARTDKAKRGEIEEAQVAVEAFAPSQIDYDLLAGLWRLEYTTAVDVVPIVGFESVLPFPSPIRVGDVYQKFTGLELGQVQNVIKFGLPGLLEPTDGVTFTVLASYEPRGARTIALTFKEAAVGEIKISPLTEALLAPAILPRGSLNHQLLMRLREFSLGVQFQTAQQLAQGRAAFANYQLTYLDQDLLIGRAQGTFIFMRQA